LLLHYDRWVHFQFTITPQSRRDIEATYRELSFICICSVYDM
jgi:hypothetical protein